MLTAPQLAFAFVTFLYVASSEGYWTYSNNDTSPDKWGAVASKMCNGVKQSPINIYYSDAIYDPNLKPISIYQRGTFAPGDKFTLTNNGHTLMVSIPKCVYFLNLNGREDGEFCIRQFHFHWGVNSTVGSEHSINGEFFPLEMHIVTFDRDLYQTIEEATQGVDGLAVLALVFREDESIPIKETMLFNMGAFLQKAQEVQEAGRTATIDPFPASAMLNIGDANKYFYRYEGSLTTPPCTENVYWTVVARPIPAHPEQLKVMRYIYYSPEESQKNMANNFRSPRPVNPDNALVRRIVFRSWNFALGVAPSSLLFVLSVALNLAVIWL